jgi:hypothetical protein
MFRSPGNASERATKLSQILRNLGSKIEGEVEHAGLTACGNETTCTYWYAALIVRCRAKKD